MRHASYGRFLQHSAKIFHSIIHCLTMLFQKNKKDFCSFLQKSFSMTHARASNRLRRQESAFPLRILYDSRLQTARRIHHRRLLRFIFLQSLYHLCSNSFYHWHRNRIACLFSYFSIRNHNLEVFRKSLQSQQFSFRRSSFIVDQDVIRRGAGSQCCRIRTRGY